MEHHHIKFYESCDLQKPNNTMPKAFFDLVAAITRRIEKDPRTKTMDLIEIKFQQSISDTTLHVRATAHYCLDK